MGLRIGKAIKGLVKGAKAGKGEKAGKAKKKKSSNPLKKITGSADKMTGGILGKVDGGLGLADSIKAKDAGGIASSATNLLGL